MEEQLTLFDFSHPGYICGCDEAGRGPLAGPVCAASCILPDDFDTSILDDSKKLTEKKRAELEILIKEKALCWSTVLIFQDEIDEINILNATMKAMKLSYQRISRQLPVSRFLVDGNRKPPVTDTEVEAIVKGDAKIPQIMAASILAKTERDRYMINMDRLYPEYGFAIHKGYGTRRHYEAIKEYGPTPLHRLSFLRSLKEEQA